MNKWIQHEHHRRREWVRVSGAPDLTDGFAMFQYGTPQQVLEALIGEADPTTLCYLSPLHCVPKHPMKVKMLLDHGAFPNAQSDMYSTPLHLAVHYNCLESVQLLLEHGADKTIQDIHKRTPMDLAHTDEMNALLNG